MSMNIEGKVVVITGASSGLGEATARHLASQGAVTVLAARCADRIKWVVAELVAGGGRAFATPVDVTRSEQVQRLVDLAVEQYGRIDVMLNNAGVAPLSLLEAGRTEEWNRMIDVNVKGVLYGIAAALPHMKRQRSGHFINVSSVAADKITPATAVYSATKAAVRVI